MDAVVLRNFHNLNGPKTELRSRLNLANQPTRDSAPATKLAILRVEMDLLIVANNHQVLILPIITQPIPITSINTISLNPARFSMANASCPSEMLYTFTLL